MRKSDVICPACHAGFQRIELTSAKGRSGNFCCPVCSHLIESLDDSTLVAYRLTVNPIMKVLKEAPEAHRCPGADSIAASS